jgi:hypothetical protein
MVITCIRKEGKRVRKSYRFIRLIINLNVLELKATVAF